MFRVFYLCNHRTYLPQHLILEEKCSFLTILDFGTPATEKGAVTMKQWLKGSHTVNSCVSHLTYIFNRCF